ncbi:hypothetical protein [Nocardioides sp. W7]|uniref:hypothetical protein n=1 Tax=Nocardioides sp. W7 TaxID=2931390 RepID=UPI001FD4DFC7|nr:hypothetical protein [Nocardioides sp. W7]
MLNRATTGLVSALLGTVLGAVLLTGCSGDSDSGSEKDSSDASTSASASASSLPVPDGVELTEQGSELAVGDTATLAWEPRQGSVGVIDVRVDRLEKTSFTRSFAGWRIDEATKQTRPYFVRATITNTGETDLGGRRVPLYVVDGENRLVDYSGFGSSFTTCPSTDFPEPFAPGASAEFCLVYLVPDRGGLTAVSFRPTQDVNPITWTGELTRPEPVRASKKKKDEKPGS